MMFYYVYILFHLLTFEYMVINRPLSLTIFKWDPVPLLII